MISLATIAIVLLLLRPHKTESFSPSPETRKASAPLLGRSSSRHALQASTRTSNEGQPIIGTELFQNGGSYVPQGLSPEQYESIKKDEAEARSKLNLGMWGPRFRQTDRPDGDWMAMPSLWTRGFRSDAVTGRESGAADPSSPGAIGGAIREFAPAFLLSYAAIDLLVACYGLTQAAEKSVWKLLRLSARIVLMKQQVLLVGSVKLTAIKCTAAMAMTRPVTNAVEWANRKWLMSSRRSYGTILLALVASLLSMSVLLPGMNALTVILKSAGN